MLLGGSGSGSEKSRHIVKSVTARRRVSLLSALPGFGCRSLLYFWAAFFADFYFYDFCFRIAGAISLYFQNCLNLFLLRVFAVNKKSRGVINAAAQRVKKVIRPKELHIKFSSVFFKRCRRTGAF